MSNDRAARVERLQAAAARKHDDAVQRAGTAIDQLVKAHQAITFRAVARAGSVSVDFLYRQAELRTRIDGLRNAEHGVALPAAAPERSTVVHALTSQLRAVRSENQDLRRRLESAHGRIVELQRLTRYLPQMDQPAG